MSMPPDDQLRMFQTYAAPVRTDDENYKPAQAATRAEHTAHLAQLADELERAIAVIEEKLAQLEQVADMWPDDMPLGDFVRGEGARP